MFVYYLNFRHDQDLYLTCLAFMPYNMTTYSLKVELLSKGLISGSDKQYIKEDGKAMKTQLMKDPLHQILERHLLRTAEGEVTEALIQTVLNEYLSFLHSQGAHIPVRMKELFIKDLREEIREQLIKRTYNASAPTDPKKHSIRFGNKPPRKDT